MTRKLLVFLLVLIAFLLPACGPGTEAAVATAIAETQQISQLQTASAGGEAAVQEQPATTDTPSPGLAFVSVSQNTNCRSGPSTSYSILTTIDAGQQVEVLKTFSDEYVLVKNPNSAGDCWLFLQFADTSDFIGFNLEAATQPPTPELASNPASTQEQEDAQDEEVEEEDEPPPLEISVDVHLAEANFTQPGDTCEPVKLVWEAQITANRPTEIAYYWSRENLGIVVTHYLTFSSAGTQSVNFRHEIYATGGNERTSFARITITSPISTSDQDDVTFSCP